MGLPLKNARNLEDLQQPTSDDNNDVPVPVPDTDRLTLTSHLPPLIPVSTGCTRGTGEVHHYVINQPLPRGTPGIAPRSTDDMLRHFSRKWDTTSEDKAQVRPDEWVLSQPQIGVMDSCQVTNLLMRSREM